MKSGIASSSELTPTSSVPNGPGRASRSKAGPGLVKFSGALPGPSLQAYISLGRFPDGLPWPGPLGALSTKPEQSRDINRRRLLTLFSNCIVRHGAVKDCDDCKARRGIHPSIPLTGRGGRGGKRGKRGIRLRTTVL